MGARNPLTSHSMEAAHIFTGPFDPSTPYASRENSRDGYPGVIHPLDLTTISVPADRGMRRCLRDVGMWKLDPPGLLCNRVFQGRMYVNISWVLWHGDALPGICAADFEQQLFGQHVGLKISRPRVSRAEKVVAALMSWRLVLGHLRAILGRDRRLAKALKDRSEFDVRTLPDRQLAALIPSLRRDIEIASDWNTRGTIFAMTAIGALTRAAGTERAHVLLPLLSDVGDVESAAPARRLRALATNARQIHPSLGAELSASSDRWETLASRAPKVRHEIDALLKRYGYRSMAEFYLSSPSWADDPTPVMDAFVGLLQPSDGRGEQESRASTNLKALLVGVGPIKRLRLTLLARAARAGACTREVTKAALVIRVDIVRRLMREVAGRMVAAGHLKDPRDVYFLTLDDVLTYLNGGRVEGLSELIEPRRTQKRALEEGPEPPDLLCGFEPLEPALAVGSGEVGSVMSGVGISGGIVEGVARVIHGTDALDRFEPGEILVAPYTDAGWTPYFTMASAVIVENGGLMTHTSVVARELGLPSLVNVRNATSLIRTGDRLRLDADQGVVKILERALAPALTS
jgi:phosphohistidine swiveling domain-containing protein